MELSRANRALLRSLYTRHGRKKSGCCVVEGPRAVSELSAAAPGSIRFLIHTGDVPPGVDAPCIPVTESEFHELSGTIHGQGILAVAQSPAFVPAGEPADDPYLFALDRVADPGNFGTICRTARAAGLRELWITEGTADPYGDKALRSGLGSQFAMRIRFFSDLNALRQAADAIGYGPVWLTDPHTGTSLYAEPDLYRRSVVVIGSEGGGVADLAQAPRVTIPMPGNFESLNAAQAATIFLFESVRRRETPAISQ